MYFERTTNEQINKNENNNLIHKARIIQQPALLMILCSSARRCMNSLMKEETNEQSNIKFHNWWIISTSCRFNQQ